MNEDWKLQEPEGEASPQKEGESLCEETHQTMIEKEEEDSFLFQLREPNKMELPNILIDNGSDFNLQQLLQEPISTQSQERSIPLLGKDGYDSEIEQLVGEADFQKSDQNTNKQDEKKTKEEAYQTDIRALRKRLDFLEMS